MDRQSILDQLMDELDRLVERYQGKPDAIEALEAVRYWAIEESVEYDPERHML